MGLFDFMAKGKSKGTSSGSSDTQNSSQENENNGLPNNELAQTVQGSQVHPVGNLQYPSPELTPVDDLLKEIELPETTVDKLDIEAPLETTQANNISDLPQPVDTITPAQPTEEIASNNQVIDNSLTDLPSDDEIDKLLAQYSDANVTRESEQTTNLSPSSSDAIINSNETAQETTGPIISQFASTEADSTNAVNIETPEIPVPEVIPETGEVVQEHVPIDNTVIQNTNDAVTFTSPDGVVETINPTDLSAIAQFTNTTPIDNIDASFVSSTVENMPTNVDTAEMSDSIPHIGDEVSSVGVTNTEVSDKQDILMESTPENLNSNETTQTDYEGVENSVIPPMLPSVEQETRPKTNQDLFVLKNIRSIALVGLNDTDGVFDDVGSDLVNFSNALPLSTELIIDSSKMAGGELLRGVEKHVSITGVFLKPFFTNYSDIAEQVPARLNFRSILFSNYFEKISHIVHNAELIVVPLTSGLVNLANVSNLLAIQYIYGKQAKPVVLLGKEWRDFIDSLNLNEEESSSIRFADNVSELLELVKKLDVELFETVAVDSVQESVVDMREQGDETHFLRN